MKTFTYPHSAKRGFTLIELLVVVAIIGLLSSVVLASLNGARQKGRDARRIADLKQMQIALELIFDATNPPEYPNGSGSLDPTYIAIVPVDPLTGSAYGYDNLTNGNAACSTTSDECVRYVIGATLEDSTNPALRSDVDGTVGSIDCADPVFCVAP